MQWLSQYKISLFLLVFLAVFFCIYAYFNLIVIQPPDTFQAASLIKFNSPDETANYFWIKQIVQHKPFYYFEPLNYPGTNLIHARSLNTIDGKITPGSFLGLPIIYGFLARGFGLSIVPYLTPFFSVLGLFFFYLLIKDIFKNKDLALLSTVLLGFFPAWFYYSARGLYHNILFISLLIIGFYILLYILKPFKKENYLNFLKIKALSINLKFKIYNLKLFLYFLSGLLIGLSIITRTSEIVWVALTVGLIFIINFKKIYWSGFILFLTGLWLPLLILFYYNQILYGSFISAGYRSIIPHGDVIQAAASGLLFKILVTPFGFNLKSILINTYNYLFKFLPVWSSLALAGGLLFVIWPTRGLKLAYRRRWFYLFYVLIITIYLGIFYGSWQFSDRIDGQLISLGSSYLRYWLPIYLLTIPLVAFLILSLTKLILPKINQRWSYYRLALISAIVFILFMSSFNLTVRATDESLWLLNNLNRYRLQAKIIVSLTQPDDIIIIYPQADKIFFPQRRKIITALVVPADYQAVARLAKIRRLYYYTFAPPATVKFISRRDFEPYGLKIINGQLVLGHNWLYQISQE